MKYYTIFFGMLVIAGTIVYATITYLNLKTLELANTAKFECTQSSRYTTTQSDGSVVWYPVDDLYKKCLKEKNIK